jgi:opacity protein-like surface antigen
MKRIFSTLFFSLLIISPQIVCAEWFENLYINGAFTNDREIKQNSSEPTFSKKENIEKSATGGCKVGHWFSKFPYLGLTIDGSILSADPDLDKGHNKDADLLLVPISTLAMGRIPILKDSDHPMGKFQIYGGVGPAMFYSKAGIKKFFVTILPGDFITEDSKHDSINLGLDSQLGVSWMFDKNAALQLKFKYKHFEPKDSNRIFDEDSEQELEVETYQSLIGLSYRF